MTRPEIVAYQSGVILIEGILVPSKKADAEKGELVILIIIKLLRRGESSSPNTTQRGVLTKRRTKIREGGTGRLVRLGLSCGSVSADLHREKYYGQDYADCSQQTSDGCNCVPVHTDLSQRGLTFPVTGARLRR